MTKKISSGYADHSVRTHAWRASAAAGTATISEKAMCMLGTAAYWLTSRLAVCESCATPVKLAIVSVNPNAREQPRRRGREQRVADQGDRPSRP